MAEQAQQKSGDWNAIWGDIVRKAWNDEAFKERLVNNTQSVLTEAGLRPPEGVEVKIMENTSAVVHLTLPAKPVEDLDEADLARVVGGGKIGGRWWGGGMLEVTGISAISTNLIRY